VALAQLVLLMRRAGRLAEVPRYLRMAETSSPRAVCGREGAGGEAGVRSWGKVGLGVGLALGRWGKAMRVDKGRVRNLCAHSQHSHPGFGLSVDSELCTSHAALPLPTPSRHCVQALEPGLHFCKGLYARYSNNFHEALQELNLARKDNQFGVQAIYNMVEIYLNPESDLNVRPVTTTGLDIEVSAGWASSSSRSP
jgi:hypothetical protein